MRDGVAGTETISHRGPGPRTSTTQVRVRLQNPNSVPPPLHHRPDGSDPGAHRSAAGVGVDGTSTNEHHHDRPDASRPDNRLLAVPVQDRGVCSLERR